jgi:hypothetical protein
MKIVDANVGVVRELTMEPNIKSARGYLDLKDDKLDELKDVNLFGTAELLTPLGITTDESIRSSMAVKQSKHIIPVTKSSPVLISNGSEQAVVYHLSDDFCVTAQQDGFIIDKDEEAGLVMIEYKDGSHRAININPKIVKNGAGAHICGDIYMNFF